MGAGARVGHMQKTGKAASSKFEKELKEEASKVKAKPKKAETENEGQQQQQATGSKAVDAAKSAVGGKKTK